jgi:hypothetical protein
MRHYFSLRVYVLSWLNLFVSDTLSFRPLFICEPRVQSSARRSCRPSSSFLFPSSSSRADHGSGSSVCLQLALENDADSVNDEEEEEEDPLAKGIDSVSWLPSVKDKHSKGKETDVSIFPSQLRYLTFIFIMVILYHPVLLSYLHTFPPERHKTSKCSPCSH